MDNTVERPFSCGLYGKAYKLKHHVSQHVKTAHGGNRVACGECNATFGIQADLSRHFAVIHRPVPPQPMSPAFRPANPPQPTPGTSASNPIPLLDGLVYEFCGKVLRGVTLGHPLTTKLE